jgi:hypothetical protein
MRYMFLIYSNEANEAAAPEPARRARALQHQAIMREAADRGVFLGADPLEPTSTATTLRSTDGKPVIIDGPFAETKEQLAGYYMLECRDLDEAIEWGKRIPFTCQGTDGCIEIRPVHEIHKP